MLTYILANVSFHHQLMRAVCATLFYSCCLGMIVVLCTGLLLAATRNTRAAVRYNLLVATLFLFAAGVGFIFTNQWQAAHPILMLTAYAPGIDHRAATPFLEAHSNVFVFAWFLFICMKSAYMGIGLQRLYRMKRKQVRPAGLYLEGMLARLSGQLQIGTAICLLESGLAKVPMVIGWLKPVILLPVGLLASLSQEEAEAILLHELAHIRRMDFLVSLLQNLMEILFFFNPAVWWLSYLIRREREHCCDELVIAQTKHKTDYIRALLHCQAFQISTSRYAMTLFNDDKELLGRVKRLAGRPVQLNNGLEKTILSLCLVGILVAAMAFSQGAAENPRMIHYRTADGRIGVINQDTLTEKGDPDEALLRKLAVELTAEKRITGLAGLDGLKLNDTTFQVNGFTLPEALRSKYKNKYLPQTGYGIYYGNVRFSGRGTFIIIPKFK